jgi:hypothetical protein
MADEKSKRTSPQGRSAGKHPSESSPNPHGEQKVIEMPIRTDQKRETRSRNVAGTPSTAGGRLNPSVVHDFQPRAGAGKSKSPQPAQQRNPARPREGNQAGTDGKKEA